MINLKLEKKKLELAKTQLARQDMEYRILEKLDEIERIKKSVDILKVKEQEMAEELSKPEEPETE